MSGRRDTKAPGSVEWIIQTTRLASVCLASLESSTEEWKKVVSELEEQCVWEHFPPDQPYGTRDAYFIGEFGRPEPELTAAKVKQQSFRQKSGRPKKGEEYPDAIRISAYGTDPDYIRFHLEQKGRSDLLERIDRQEISVHAAGIEAGIVHRLIRIQPTVEGFARAATKHLSAGDRRELCERLEGHVG